MPPAHPPLAPTGRDAPALAAWHAGWAAGLALLGLAAAWLGRGLPDLTLLGLALMILPGVGGLTLLWRDSAGVRMAGLMLWSVAVFAALVLTGGLTGSLTAFVFMPIVAGLALGGRRLALIGGATSGFAALSGLISALVAGPGPHLALLSTALAVLVAGAAAAAVELTWRDRDARVRSAEEETARLSALVTGQPGLTLVLEPSGRVLAAYGAAPAALAVDPLFEAGLIAAVHAPDRPAVLSALDRALAGQEAQALFAPRAALDRRIQLILRRLDDPAHGDRIIVQAFDGTAQYAREVELETARAEAEAQNAGKTRFLANMSHELRTPLNAVLGFADIMRQRLFGPLPDRYAEYAASIHEAGGHLLALINDVLDVSKIEAERYQLSRERLDARDVVSAAVALVRLSADDKGVALASVLPGEPIPVDADRRALKQIALNLLSNAIKFTPAGGSVTVTLEAIGPYLELVVSDTGVGIAPEDLRRLGRPFEQAGGAEQRAQGTGLGLSLVRALAELHGGRLTIDSTLGEGAAVTVRMPVVVVDKPSVPTGGAEIIPLNAGKG